MRRRSTDARAVVFAVLLAASGSPASAQDDPLPDGQQLVPPIGSFITANSEGPALSEGTVAATVLEVDRVSGQLYALAWRAGEEIRVAVLGETPGQVLVGPLTLDQDSLFVEPPGIASDGDGNFVVAWRRDRGADGVAEIVAQAFRPPSINDVGVLAELGPLQVLGCESPEPRGADCDVVPNLASVREVMVAGSSSGRFALLMVTKEGQPFPRRTRNRLVHRLVDLELGGFFTPVPTNPDWKVLRSEDTEKDLAPDLAMNRGDADHVVVWSGSIPPLQASTSGRISDSGPILAQRISGLGTLEGEPIAVADSYDDPLVSDHDPGVSFAEDGSFWIVWERNLYEVPDPGSGVRLDFESRVLASRFDASGVEIQSEVRVDSETVNESRRIKRNPSIGAEDADGDVVAVWERLSEACEFVGLPDFFFSPAVIAGHACGSADVPPAGGSCVFEVDIDIYQEPGALGDEELCRWSAELRVPSPDLHGTSWIHLRSNGESIGSDLLRIHIDPNGSSFQNRCFEVAVLGEVLEYEQHCQQPDPDNCTTCEEQLFGRRATRRDEPSAVEVSRDVRPAGAWRSLADPPVSRSEARGVPAVSRTLQARWLESRFQSPEASFVPTFERIRIQYTDRDFYLRPEVALQRDGEFLLPFLRPDGDRVQAHLYEPPVRLSINDIGVFEAGPSRATAAFTLRADRAHPNGETPQVRVRSIADTATSGEDYVAVPPGTLVEFRSDDDPELQLLEVEILDDLADPMYEGTEQFRIRLSEESRAIIDRREGLGVILDNELPETVSVEGDTACENGSLLAGCAGAGDPAERRLRFRISIDSPQAVEGSVRYRTAVDDGDHPATPNVDFEAIEGEVQIPAGATEVFVTVEVSDDGGAEEPETLLLEVFDPTDLTVDVTANSGVGTILNDDDCPVDQLPTALLPTNDLLEVDVLGGARVICVENPASCLWSVALEDSNETWLSATEALGALDSCLAFGGDGFEIEVNPNQGASRTADVEFFNGGETASQTLTVAQEGEVCNVVVSSDDLFFFSAGGPGVFSGGIPEFDGGDGLCDGLVWEASANREWIEDLEPESGSADDEIVDFTFVIPPNPSLQSRTGQILVGGAAVLIRQEGRFFDDFTDGKTAPNWQLDPAVAWLEPAAGTHLEADSASGSATAVARPAFDGCSDCELRTTLRYDRFSKGIVSIYGWYRDETDHFELQADEFADRWRFFAVRGGEATLLGELAADILVGDEAEVHWSRTGDGMRVRIDGIDLCPPGTGGVPVCPVDLDSGARTFGYRVVETDASFDFIDVVRSSNGSEIFRDGFESGDTGNW